MLLPLRCFSIGGCGGRSPHSEIELYPFKSLPSHPLLPHSLSPSFLLYISFFFLKTDLDGHGSIFFAAIVQLLMELSQDLSGLLLFNAHP